MMQARKVKYDVIGPLDRPIETRGHRSLNTSFEIGGELFRRICDTRDIVDVGVPGPALTFFVVYPPKSSYEEEELETFYMDLERLHGEDHNVKTRPRRSLMNLTSGPTGWKGQGEKLSKFIMTRESSGHGSYQDTGVTR
ncbi:hypothetical protein V3C99_013793 [Haemonchus contortus]|uniref:Uncharacterized protein n=1 Tax=Haemonchus contortus TaxID=6289 RepID=A0A7I4YQW6_HAECO